MINAALIPKTLGQSLDLLDLEVLSSKLWTPKVKARTAGGEEQAWNMLIQLITIDIKKSIFLVYPYISIVIR